MNRRSSLVWLGAPLLFGVIVLTVLIASVVADGNHQNDRGVADRGDEYKVEQVNIDSIEILLAESYPVQVFVEVTGYIPDPCWRPQEPVIEQDAERFEVEILAERTSDEMCVQVIEEYNTTLELGSVDPGNYVINVNGIEQAFEVN